MENSKDIITTPKSPRDTYKHLSCFEDIEQLERRITSVIEMPQVHKLGNTTPTCSQP